MPMMKGHSADVVRSNVREMIKAGHKPKQAIAASLASARKYKKMYAGGMVEDPDKSLDDLEGEHRGIAEMDIEAEDRPESVVNPEVQDANQMLASALSKKAEEDEMKGYAMGGLVEPEVDPELGTKPVEDMEDSTEEPMSAAPMKPASGYALPADVMAAIEAKKKKRKFMKP